MEQDLTLDSCVANKRLKLSLESSGSDLSTTGENLPSIHFHLHCFKMGSAGLLSSLISVSQQNAKAEKLMYFKTQTVTEMNSFLLLLCYCMVTCGSSWQHWDKLTRYELLFQTAWNKESSVCVNTVSWTSQASLTYTHSRSLILLSDHLEKDS